MRLYDCATAIHATLRALWLGGDRAAEGDTALALLAIVALKIGCVATAEDLVRRLELKWLKELKAAGYMRLFFPGE